MIMLPVSLRNLSETQTSCRRRPYIPSTHDLFWVSFRCSPRGLQSDDEPVAFLWCPKHYSPRRLAIARVINMALPYDMYVPQGLSPDYVHASWQVIDIAQVMDIALYIYFPANLQEPSSVSDETVAFLWCPKHCSPRRLTEAQSTFM